MATDTVKKIADYKSRLAALEQELYAELATLPGRYGFASAEEFAAAVRKAAGLKIARKAPKPAKAPKAAKAAKTAKTKKASRKPRAKITPEVEAQVKTLVEGGKTGAEIAKELGISLPSVQNVKKKLGLVKPRGEAPAA